MPSGGHNRLPNKTKEAQGTADASRRNDDEPVYDGDLLQAPANWDNERKALWNNIIPQIVRAGVAQNPDQTALEDFINLMHRKEDMMRRMDFEPDRIMGARGEMANPFWSQWDRILTQSRQYYSEFGLTPASRARVKSSGRSKQETPFSDLL